MCMRTLKAVFGVIGALMPVLYFGYLIYYFVDVSGSLREAETNGLGPILIGLGIFAALLCIPLLIKIVRLFVTQRAPRSGGPDDPGPSGHDGGFDADAVVARYLAERRSEPAPARDSSSAARRTGFGRRNR